MPPHSSGKSIVFRSLGRRARSPTPGGDQTTRCKGTREQQQKHKQQGNDNDNDHDNDQHNSNNNTKPDCPSPRPLTIITHFYKLLLLIMHYMLTAITIIIIVVFVTLNIFILINNPWGDQTAPGPSADRAAHAPDRARRLGRGAAAGATLFSVFSFRKQDNPCKSITLVIHHPLSLPVSHSGHLPPQRLC